MARNPRRGAIRRALLTRRAGWGLAAALALLGILLGWHQFTRAAGLAGQAFAEAARLVLDAGWLLLLLAAAGLVLGLARGPRRAAFPAALIVLAAALGWWGRLELVASTPTPPQPANTGNIMVYTSDPKTSVELSIHSALNLSGETLPGYQWLHIYVRFENADGHNLPPLWWVVTLGFDAVLPPGEFPASGTIPTFFSRPYHEPGWTNVGGDKPASFLNGVTWPEEEYGDGSAVFRHEPEGGDATGGLTIDMAIKVREPLLQDSGEYVTLSTPTLGRPQAARNSEPISLRVVEPEQGAAPDPQLVKLLGNQRWYEPEDVQVQFEAPLTGVRQEAGTTPIAPFRTEWRAKDRLKVDASFARPGEDAKNERRIFFAGILVSLAASFFVWALELLLGPGRDPVAAPRRRP